MLTTSQLMRAGKPKTVVCAAIARELAGFVWAIATEMRPAGKKGTGKPATRAFGPRLRRLRH